MKRSISLALLLCMLFTLCACSPDNIISPEVTPEQDEVGSAPISEQKPDDADTESDTQNVNTAYIDPNKAKNDGIMPTADIDKLALSAVKTTDLKNKELTFYVSEQSAFSAGALTETQWMDTVAEQLGVKLNYSVRADSTLYSAQSISQKAGKKLDIVTSLVSNLAPSRSLMRSALSLTGAEQNLTFSKRVYDLSGGRLFTAKGVSKMMWYNTDIISDAKAYDYFEKDEWTNLTLDFLTNDIIAANKGIIECDNWAAFGSASGYQSTGLAGDGSFVITLETAETINSFSTFAKIFEKGTADKKNTFKNGGTAFSYTDAPVLDSGALSFVPIPSLYGKGQCVTELSGVGMGVSASTDDISAQYALTFILLWSARYSEARADALVYSYGLTPQKASKYIEYSETMGGLYNADSEISSYFETDAISKSLYGDPNAVVAAFQGAYNRAVLLNSRNQ